MEKTITIIGKTCAMQILSVLVTRMGLPVVLMVHLTHAQFQEHAQDANVSRITSTLITSAVL
jgi:hypothetical protein